MDTKDKLVIVTDLTCMGTDVYVNGEKIGFIKGLELSLNVDSKNDMGSISLSRSSVESLKSTLFTSDINKLTDFLQETASDEFRVSVMEELKE